MENVNPPPVSVYETYEAVEECARAYYEASKIVRKYHRLSEHDGRYAGLIDGLDSAHSRLTKHVAAMENARPSAAEMVELLKRDIHRACADRELVEWEETTASSVAEGIIAITGKVLDQDWDVDSLRLPERNNQRILLLRAPENHERIVALLNREAARVVQLQESKGPDLSRLTELERRIYAAVLLHGSIDEKELNQMFYGDPRKGDTRKTAGPMARHGIFEQTASGYVVRKAGTLSPQT